METDQQLITNLVNNYNLEEIIQDYLKNERIYLRAFRVEQEYMSLLILEKYNISSEKNFVYVSGIIDYNDTSYIKVAKFFKYFYYKRTLDSAGIEASQYPIMPYLKDLRITGNDLITTLPEYPSLKSLTCIYSNLRFLPSLNKLEYLNVNNSAIKYIQNFPKLTMCYANYSQLIEIKGVPKLTEFYIEGSRVENLPSVFELPELEVLHTSMTKIKTIPPYLHLVELQCGNIESISPLPSLEKLYIFGTLASPLPLYPRLKQMIAPLEVYNNNPYYMRLHRRDTNMYSILRSYDSDSESESNIGSVSEHQYFESEFEEDADVSQYNVSFSDRESVVENFTVDRCTNDSVITLMPYSKKDKGVFGIYLQHSDGKFKKASCLTRQELLFQIKSNIDEDPPRDFACIYTTPLRIGDLQTGLTGKPTDKIVFKLPNLQIFITLGSLFLLLKNKESAFYAIPLYAGLRRRVGNLSGIFGASMNHGQVPGYTIYKLFTKREIVERTAIQEEISDFPIKLEAFKLSERGNELWFS